MSQTYIIGDIHGQYEKLVALLRGAGLVNESLRWAAGDATLRFMGDFVDRGPAGLAVIDLVMRLQHEAAGSGGAVHALMGNHEPLLMAAYRFGAAPSGGPGGTFRSSWLANGGLEADLAGLTTDHVRWLSALPAMALLGSDLLLHADAMLYLRYGSSVGEVNQAFADLMACDDPARWDQLLGDFSERDAFTDRQPGGVARAAALLGQFGGRRIIHGHTPVHRHAGLRPDEVTGPLTYAGGLCVNVDPGLYLGGQGFVWQVG